MRGPSTGLRLAASRLEPTSAGGVPTGDPDAPLVLRAKAGDRTALCELYRRHVDGVFRRLTHLLGSDPEREDLTQQIFAEVLRGLRGFRGEAKFRTYLYRVTANRACDHLRRRRRFSRWSAEADEVASPAPSPEQSAERTEELAQVWHYLDRIKPKKRVAFVLRVVEGLSFEEIATETGARPSAVAKRVAHAQRELLAMLEADRRRGNAWPLRPRSDRDRSAS